MKSFFILAISLDFSNSYVLIIMASLVLIMSSIFTLISNKTNIPSVLLLIILGIIFQLGPGVRELNLMPALEVLGIIGLIMIVLEAALELELNRSKYGVIGRSFLVALISLIVSALLTGFLFKYTFQMTTIQAFIYATPLSIMSSAIIIPSVSRLIEDKKEFMVYDSTFSDVLGIMFFYFLLSFSTSGGQSATIQFGGSLIITILVAVIASYLLVFIFKDFKQNARLFLLIAILLLMYSGGKLLHLSPLLIILIFGLALSNHQRFFKLFRNHLQKDDPIERIEKEFHLITRETAFVVRSFFFVVFGMTIELSSLLNFRVLAVSLVVLIVLYAVRYFSLKMISKQNLSPELFIAPRGLITILLFFAIPSEIQIESFQSGILLYVIIMTSLFMTYALIKYAQKGKTQS